MSPNESKKPRDRRQDTTVLYRDSDDLQLSHVEASADSDLSVSEQHPAAENDETRQGGIHPQPGTAIGDFIVSREIGRGGMGVVYEAQERSLNRVVALKVLPLAALIDARQIRRFQNEARAAAQLHHPHIVPVYSVGIDRGIHYYAMQLVDGQNLAAILSSVRDRRRPDAGPMSETPPLRGKTVPEHVPVKPRESGEGSDGGSDGRSTGQSARIRPDELAQAISSCRTGAAGRALFRQIARMGADVAEALSHAHGLGIVHRDIKPSNLMLDSTGKIWVTDFGLAMVADSHGMTRTGDVVGTLRYMSPEQASGKRFLVDHRADVYSLAVTLYEVLTLHRAFDADDARDIIRQVSFGTPTPMRRLNPSIPAELDIVIGRAMAHNPHERYETAAAFADDLRRFADDQPIRARRPTVIRKCQRWVSRHRGLATSGAIGLIFALTVSLAAAGVIWNALAAETEQRERVESLLDTSEGWRLISNSSLQLQDNPGLALALAVEGAERVSGFEVNQTVLAALNSNHELQRLVLRDTRETSLTASRNDAGLVGSVSDHRDSGDNVPALVTEIGTGTEIARIGSGGRVTSLAFSHDNTRMLITETASNPDTANSAPSLWNVGTEQKIVTFSGTRLTEAREHLFSPEGDHVVLPGENNSVGIFTTDDGTRRLGFPLHEAPVAQAIFSQNGELVASADADRVVWIWRSSDAAAVRRIDLTTESAIDNLSFSADSMHLVISTRRGTSTWEANADASGPAARWLEPRHVMHPAANRGCTYYPRSQRLRIRSTKSPAIMNEITVDDGIRSVAYSSDGRQLVICAGPTASVFDERSGALLCRLQGHEADIVDAVFVNRDQEIVTTALDGTIRYWSVQSGRDRMRIPVAAWSGIPIDVSWTADSRQLLLASAAQHRTWLIDEDGNVLTQPVSGRLRGDTVLESILSLADDTTVRLVDPLTSAEIAKTDLLNWSVREVVPIGARREFVVLSEGGPAFWWIPDKDVFRRMTDASDPAYCCAVSPDSSIVAVGLASGFCRLFDSESGDLQTTLLHESGVQAVRFFPDSSRLVTIDSQNRAYMHRVAQDSPAIRLESDGITMNDCVVCDQGRVVLTFDRRTAGRVSAWNTETGNLLDQAESASGCVCAGLADSAVAAIVSAEGVRVWRIGVAPPKQLSNRPSLSIALSGTRLAVIQPNGAPLPGHPPMELTEDLAPGLEIHDLETGERIAELTFREFPVQVALGATEGQFAVSGTTYPATIVSRDSLAPPRSMGDHSGPITYAAHIGTTGRIVTASHDTTAKVWSSDGRLLHELKAHTAPILSGACTPDGAVLATCDQTGRIVLWTPSSGEQLREPAGHTAGIHVAICDDSGQHLLTASHDGSVHRLDLRTDVQQVFDIPGGVLDVRLLADNHQALILTGTLRTVQFNNRGSRTTRAIRLEKDSDSVDAFLVDLDSGEQTEIVQDGVSVCIAATHAGNGFALLSGDGQIEVRLTDDLTVAPIRLSTGLQRIAATAFSPDDRLLAVLTMDSIAVFDLQTQREVLQVSSETLTHTPGNLVPSARHWTPFAPDGRHLMATGSRIEFWPLNPTSAAGVTQRDLTAAERRRFRVGLAAGDDSAQMPREPTSDDVTR